ncbi:MAG: hypothetical protein Q8R76_13115, partial [Candidatus Omnitrophota bacterium]|nr:hypothetical protein [Candidatus Omnitrophota bacterium]
AAGLQRISTAWLAQGPDAQRVHETIFINPKPRGTKLSSGPIKGVTPIVLLAFYQNDFMDNLTPVDRYVRFPPDIWIQRYEVIIDDKNASVRKRSQDEIFRIYQKMIGCPEKQAELPLKDAIREQVVYKTRLGTQLYILLHKIKKRILGNQQEAGSEGKYTVTRNYVAQMDAFLKQREAPFYVLVIPDVTPADKLLSKSKEYLTAVQLFRELDLATLEPFEIFAIDDYVRYTNTGSFDDHWNNNGHHKMFTFIRDCLDTQARTSIEDYCLSRNS